jgi:hypothetical protein
VRASAEASAKMRVGVTITSGFVDLLKTTGRMRYVSASEA